MSTAPKYIKVRGHVYRKAAERRPRDLHPNLSVSREPDWTDAQLDSAAEAYRLIIDRLEGLAENLKSGYPDWFRGFTGRDPESYQRLPGLDDSEIASPKSVLKTLNDLWDGLRDPVYLTDRYLRAAEQYMEYWADQKRQEREWEETRDATEGA